MKKICAIVINILFCFLFSCFLVSCDAEKTKHESDNFISSGQEISESTLETDAENSGIPETVSEINETEASVHNPEATFLHDDGMHRYYKIEPYKILDRFVKDSDGNLRKRFNVQVTLLNRIAETSKELEVNFYVYVCTRMQDTEYFKDLVPDERSTNDFYNEFMTTVTGSAGIDSLDISDIGKRKEYLWDTDHHWSALGAYSAYVDIVEMMSKNTPEIGAPIELNENRLIVFDDIKARGSYAGILKFDEYYDTFKVLDVNPPVLSTKSAFFSSYDNYSSGNYDKGTFADHYINYYNNVNTRRYTLAEPKNGKNLLLIGDSYSWWWSWLAAANFDNVFIYLPPWDKERLNYREYIKENNITDVVIMQFSDRLFFDYYNNANLTKIYLK